MNWSATSVLVTGAQGFVGSWLAQRLLDEGVRVVVPRRDVEPEARFRTEGIERRCTIAHCDVVEYESVLRVLNEHEIDAVFHLAAQTLVGVANRGPLSTWESNVRGTWTVLEACRAYGGVERIVVASSDKAYGEHEQLPYQENFPLQAIHPYDVSKACADLIARSYAATYELPVAVTRLANVYGPGDLNWSRIVPGTARSLAQNERPVIRSDGTPERDYIYVEDAVEAYLAIAASLDRSDLHGRCWNAGPARPLSVLEMVQALTTASQRPLEPDIRGQGTPDGEISRQSLDSTAIREQLGWKPLWELDRGLEATWEWYLERCA